MGAPKTIAVTEAAYRVLEGQKQPGESFSDVIIRRVRGGNYSQFIGIWSDVPAAELDAMQGRIDDMRGQGEERLSDARKRLGW